MARCGCSKGGSGGVMVAGPGLAITGDGTPSSPRRISVVADPHVCALTEACSAGNLCRGLHYDGDCIAVGISGDAGNAVTIAPEDGGLFASCPVVTTCGWMVDNLPTSGIVGGSTGAGWGNGPAGTLESFKQAVGLSLPMSLGQSYRLADGTWIVAPYATPDQPAIVPRVDGALWSDVTLPQIRHIDIDHDDAFSSCMVQEGLTALDEVLMVTRGRHVVSLEGPLEDTDGRQGTVQGLVDAVGDACAQQSVIVHLSGTATDADRARLVVARENGLSTGMTIGDEFQAAVHTPAKLAAEGIRWVYVHRSLPDATFTAYRDAGLRVLLWRALVQGDAARATTLGIAGVLADFPSYVSGRLKSRAAAPWCAPGHPAGQIHTKQITSDLYLGYLGGHAGTLSPTPAPCGWRMPDEDLGDQFGGALLGWAAPMPPTFTLTWKQRWSELDGAQRPTNNFGLMICCPDEVLPFSDNQQNGPLTNPGRTSGYLLVHDIGSAATSATTTMQIRKFNKGAAGGPSVAATGTRIHMNPGPWIQFRAIVTATTITYQRLSATGTVDYQVVMTDSSYRGPFIWTYKQQGTGGSASPRFSTAYSEWVRT